VNQAPVEPARSVWNRECFCIPEGQSGMADSLGKPATMKRHDLQPSSLKPWHF